MRLSHLFLVILTLSFSTFSATANEPVSDTVFRLISDRLSVMKDVAAWKHARNVPVENLAREKVVLEKATESAGKSGLSAPSTIAFFQAQITAAKAIQYCWIKRWETGTAAVPAVVPDLRSDIRPKLIKLGSALVQSISSALKAGAQFGAALQGRFAEVVQVECLPPENRDEIYKALGDLRPG